MQKTSNIIYLFVLWLAPMLLYAQTTPPDIEWQRLVGIASFTYFIGSGPSTEKNIHEIYQMADSSFNFVVIAQSAVVTSTGAFVGGDFPVNAGGTYWVKLDKKGRFLSKIRLTNNITTTFVGHHCPTTDGGLVLAGEDWTDKQFIRKMSPPDFNTPTWSINLPYSSSTEERVVINSIQQTTDGGYIVTGKTNLQTGNYAVSYPALTSNGYYISDLIIVKYNASGQVVWKKTYGGSGWDEGVQIKQTADGGYICLGTAGSQDGDIQGCQNPNGVYCYDDIWLLKLDALGNMQWQKSIGTTLGEFPSAIDIAQDGGYLISSLMGYDAQTAGINSYSSAIKTNAQGNVLWQTNIISILSNYTNINKLTSIRSTPDNGFIVTGNKASKLYIVKGTATGEIEWEKQYDGGIGYCIKPTLDNGYILLGGSGGYINDLNYVCGGYVVNNAIEGIWAAKLHPTKAPLPPTIQGDTLLSCTTNTILSVVNDSRSMAVTGYQWSNGANTQNISINPPLGETTYTVTITYDNRCTRTVTQKVRRNGFLVITPTSNTPTACNAATGAVTLSASGRSPWVITTSNGVVNGMSITALAAGTYNITVTDANNCTGTADIIITLPPNNISLTASITPAGCAAQSGSATLNATGGTAPYIYTCASGSVSANTISSLTAGTYTVTITDANGCTDSATITIPQAANNLQATATATQIPCAGGTGSISASATNGIEPIQYALNGGASSANNIFSGLAAANYTVVATDFTGCTISTTATINAAPLLLTAIITPQNATCGLPNGSLTANINGGTPPFTLTYTNNGTTSTTTTMDNTVRLPSSGGVGGGFAAGIYTVIFSDLNGCSIALGANITSNPPITATITTAPTHCYGEPSGSIAISNVQNAVLPVLYSLDNQPLSATNPITAVSGGAHILKIEDATGCKLETTATVVEGPRFTINAGRDTLINFGDSLVLSANIKSGFPQPPSTYAWTCTPAQPLQEQNSSAIIRPTTDATCTVTLMDSRGCSASDALLIKLKDANGIFIPNIFTPNSDGINDDFVIFGGSQIERVVLLQIFDRWGALIHQKTDFAPNTSAWNGIGKVGNVCPSSVYVYRTEILTRSGEIKTLTGDVTLLR